MNSIEIPSYLGSVLMIIFFVMTFMAKDVINSHLFAALSIIVGAYTFRYVSKKGR
jgi:hypothetical protein